MTLMFKIEPTKLLAKINMMPKSGRIEVYPPVRIFLYNYYRPLPIIMIVHIFRGGGENSCISFALSQVKLNPYLDPMRYLAENFLCITRSFAKSEEHH